jgi:phosphoglycerate dehydrogenase-like enzyme
MPYDVICLRPEADFQRIGATAPNTYKVTYRAPDDPQLPALMKEARVLLIPAVGPKLPPSLFEGSTIKLVQVTGAGVDRLDEAALRRLGIAVANVPGGSNSAVAEYAVTNATLLLRRFAWSDREIGEGHYDAFRKRMLADNLGGLEGALVGIVGLGVIGLAVARAFHAAGCRIAYFDPAPRDAKAAQALEAQPMPLDELLSKADVVTLHVPLIAPTKGMIGARELALMKPGAVLVNAARGGIVDEAALAARLETGQLGGAAVDVYSVEPPTANNPLLQLQGEARQRLILTPHIAGVTRQSFAHLFREAWSNVGRVLQGEAPVNRVY